ncbi:MAG: TonB-dependent receptor [Muribaculaceae bacterium]|nr:TonB-dependent receptor [Muribaculaceae bacterium]
MLFRKVLSLAFIAFTIPASIGAEVADSLTTESDFDITLDEFVVLQRNTGVRKLKSTALNTDAISKSELMRAACCNLGESFTTNASVDVNYSDAATGARQIKLLGLDGTYVQMLTENIPNLRGAASPYGLGYIPGPWMNSIQVSKGASSVKNGYEAITGQINIEFLKPQVDQSVMANGYVDIFGKAELNAAGNIHLNDKWSTGLLLHGENAFASHDDNNDGFIDLPRIRQISAMNRWAFVSSKYIFQAALRYLIENRKSGQDTHHGMANSDSQHEPFKINIDTQRWELFTKNAYFINTDNEENVALIASGSLHKEDASYGHRIYDVNQDNIYASLIYERKWKDGLHGISTGLSLNYDRFNQYFRLSQNLDVKPDRKIETETTPGVYAQYTYDLNSSLILMAGVRYDHSSVYGSMLTPRLHARYTILDGALSFHASAGRGYRTPHPLAENHFYLASSRKIVIGSDLQQETAMNYGGGISGQINLFGRPFDYSTEFYYTRFSHQLLVDLDTDPHAVIIQDSQNRPNYSRTFQVELSYPIIEDLLFTAAYRFTDVKVDYGYGLVQKPLTSKNKGLFSLSWTPMMGIWQLDVTLAINGMGRMPKPYYLPDGELSWQPEYKTFPQLNAQISRNFKNWEVYLGGENLTGFRQKTPIIDAANPWGDNFDATMVYAPIHGPMVYIGFRYNFTKY